MSSSLVRQLTPEELELQKKQAELIALEVQLAQRELELATFQAELHSFEYRYMQVVGIRQEELDQINAQIAKYLTLMASNHKFQPSVQLKQLYREVAKRIHPDLATDPKERERREQLMALVNRAYESGDEAQLRAILQDWESSPDSVQGEGATADLIRTIRQIAQSQERLQSIEAKLQTLAQSELHQLRIKTQKLEQFGQDLLLEMAHRFDQEISMAQQQLNELKAKMG
ncbi:J domain-containing protein [Acaryochloris sp. IP29b_bin.137]|uniref:J domain-containing protein n=1 Tax=Acaryochloris sp. IP29b_bin.137 TaxID=2969217 RepID=UPI0026357538|nr:J domain-containing protein [Acaryochloris sp. IP29b_bin.137]